MPVSDHDAKHARRISPSDLPDPRKRDQFQISTVYEQHVLHLPLTL